MKKIIILFLLLFVLGCEKNDSCIENVFPGMIHISGDSIAAGYDWSNLFPTKYYRNRSIGGSGTQHWVAISEMVPVKYWPSYVSIYWMGTNDPVYGIETAETLANYKKIIENIVSPKIIILEVLWVNCQGRSNENVSAINTGLRELVNQYPNVCFIETNKWVTDGSAIYPQYTMDGLHLNDAGYKKLFDNIGQEIINIIQSK